MPPQRWRCTQPKPKWRDSAGSCGSFGAPLPRPWAFCPGARRSLRKSHPHLPPLLLPGPPEKLGPGPRRRSTCARRCGCCNRRCGPRPPPKMRWTPSPCGRSWSPCGVRWPRHQLRLRPIVLPGCSRASPRPRRLRPCWRTRRPGLPGPSLLPTTPLPLQPLPRRPLRPRMANWHNRMLGLAGLCSPRAFRP
jgi:hypothetical protein